MRFFLSARYERLDELNGYKRALETWGHEVTSRWLRGYHQFDPVAVAVEAATQEVPVEAARFALEDQEDILAADVFVAFTEPPRSHKGRGGRYVEMGMAIMAGKRMIAIGPRENVFCALPCIQQYWTWSAFLEALTYD